MLSQFVSILQHTIDLLLDAPMLLVPQLNKIDPGPIFFLQPDIPHLLFEDSQLLFKEQFMDALKPGNPAALGLGEQDLELGLEQVLDPGGVEHGHLGAAQLEPDLGLPAGQPLDLPVRRHVHLVDPLQIAGDHQDVVPQVLQVLLERGPLLLQRVQHVVEHFPDVAQVRVLHHYRLYVALQPVDVRLGLLYLAQEVLLGLVVHPQLVGLLGVVLLHVLACDFHVLRLDIDLDVLPPVAGPVLVRLYRLPLMLPDHLPEPIPHHSPLRVQPMLDLLRIDLQGQGIPFRD